MHRQAALTKSSCSLQEISEKQFHHYQPSAEVIDAEWNSDSGDDSQTQKYFHLFAVTCMPFHRCCRLWHKIGQTESCEMHSALMRKLNETVCCVEKLEEDEAENAYWNSRSMQSLTLTTNMVWVMQLGGKTSIC